MFVCRAQLIGNGLLGSLLIISLAACTSLRPANVPTPGNVTLKITASFNEEDYSTVTRAYVYPPLRIDGKGKPLEQLFYTEDSDGNLHWHAPSKDSIGIRELIESQLEKRGFQVVPFEEILDSRNGYSILIFRAYYTPILSRDDTRQVQVLFAKLTGILLPKELDASKKRERINQEAFVRFSSLDDATTAVKTTFLQLVEHIGENDQWVGTYPFLSRRDQ